MHEQNLKSASVAGADSADGVSFRVSDFDRTLIRSIVSRAFRDKDLRRELDFIADGEDDARQTLTMDLTACHANGCPVDLVRLLDSDDVTFGHDLTGIQRHIDRRTGRLRRAFGPRTMMTDQQRHERTATIQREENRMQDLLRASHQAGRAEFAIEVAKRDEERKAAEDKRRKSARNARRRKGGPAVPSGKGMTPGKLKQSAAPANRRRRRRPGR